MARMVRHRLAELALKNAEEELAAGDEGAHRPAQQRHAQIVDAELRQVLIAHLAVRGVERAVDGIVRAHVDEVLLAARHDLDDEAGGGHEGFRLR